MKQSVDVTILGRQYSVKSASSAEEVNRVAEFVNQQLARTAVAAPTADTLHVTVLTLLNLAGSYLRPQDGQTLLSAQDRQHLEQLLERVESVVGDKHSPCGDSR